MGIRKKAVLVVLLGLVATFTAKPAEVSAAEMGCTTDYCGVSCWDLLWNCLAQGCGNERCSSDSCEGINDVTYGYGMGCTPPYVE